MRIVFVGSVIFSQKCLEKLLSLGAEIVAIVTKERSNFNADFADLSVLASQNFIPYKYVNDINHPKNIEWIKNYRPDIIFCFGWSSLIKAELLSIPRLGVIGYHPALLPSNKGRHPLIWAKVLGLKVTGSTFFFMDEGADSGDILDQKEIEISFDDTAYDLYNKMINTALNQIEYFLPRLINETFTRKSQELIGNVWRKRTKNDGHIDFRMSSISICNLVRALSMPYPGAHCFFFEEEAIIWRIKIGPNYQGNLEPGKVLSVDKGEITVKSGDGSVILQEYSFKIFPKPGDYLF